MAMRVEPRLSIRPARAFEEVIAKANDSSSRDDSPAYAGLARPSSGVSCALLLGKAVQA
jgi:hypothetical protein